VGQRSPHVDAEALAKAAARVNWWPAALAFVGVGVAYALVSDRLTAGPPWLILVVAVVAMIAARVLRVQGYL
jgi:hypothetical protein